MHEVALAFFWHQHQPYYPDDVAVENPMPWVRLHGTKDYWGMAMHLKEVPEMRATINLVPSLVVQIQGYAEGRAQDEHLRVSAIHDTAGYRHVREALSRQYDLGTREPDIQVLSVDLRGDRALTLRHTRHNNRPLHEGAQEVLKHVARLWGFGVNLESVDSYGDVTTHWSITTSEIERM
jgi:spore cortex formation protein SpoVR/YcgB (stage V sporulation)